MIIYKTICDSCGMEFNPNETFTIEVKRTSLPAIKPYSMCCNKMNQSAIIYPAREYIICKKCFEKFPISAVDSYFLHAL